ncbi:MAG: HEAT repeat domain-containing protein [Deltaproteobacteria bacterium]|nr:HEAT repeat domain-containing protein [Deltaproteobacteria bacterium]
MHEGKNIHTVFIKGFSFLLFFILLFPTNAFVQDIKGIQELVKDLQDEQPLVRWAAAEQLGKTQDAKAVGPLIEALQDEDAGVRREVVKALGAIGDPQAVKPLGKMLEDQEEFVRVHALGALEKIGGDEAVNLIIAALKNANPLVRINAATSLGRIRNAKALGPLEAVAQNDALSYVRFAAQQALAQIKNEGIVIPPAKERVTKVVADDNRAAIMTEMKEVTERIKEEYGLQLDYQEYDIMELLDIEARMQMRLSKDTIESLLGNILTPEDMERNRHLFMPPK